MKTETTTDHIHTAHTISAVQLQGAVGNVLVAVAGGVLVLAGFVTLFLPGPGLLMMLGGLSLLASRFAFARRWLGFARRQRSSFARMWASRPMQPAMQMSNTRAKPSPLP